MNLEQKKSLATFDEVEKIINKLTRAQKCRLLIATMHKINGAPLPDMDEETKAACDEYMALLGLD